MYFASRLRSGYAIKLARNPISKHQLFVVLIVSMLLSACATNPKSPTSAPVVGAKAAPLAANDRTTYANAIAELEQGNAKEATASLAKIADANPGYVVVWVNLAMANYTIKRNEDAIRAIEHAHKLQPQAVDILNVKGLIYAEEGRYKEAEQLYLTAVKLDSKNANVHYNLALLYDIYYQDIAKAVPHYENYLSLSNKKDEKTEAWTDELKQTLKRRNVQ